MNYKTTQIFFFLLNILFSLTLFLRIILLHIHSLNNEYMYIYFYLNSISTSTLFIKDFSLKKKCKNEYSEERSALIKLSKQTFGRTAKVDCKGRFAPMCTYIFYLASWTDVSPVLVLSNNCL